MSGVFELLQYIHTQISRVISSFLAKVQKNRKRDIELFGAYKTGSTASTAHTKKDINNMQCIMKKASYKFGAYAEDNLF